MKAKNRFFVLLIAGLFAFAGCGDPEVVETNQWDLGDDDGEVGDSDGDGEPADGDADGDGDGEEPGDDDGEEPGDDDGEEPGDGDGEEPGDGDGEEPGDGDGTDPGDGDGDGTDPGDGDDPLEPLMCEESFGEAEACGGDPVGVWAFESACTDQDLTEQMSEFCEGDVELEIIDVALTSSGTLTVTADDFTRSVTHDLLVEAIVPQNCQAIIAFLGCENLGPMIEAFVDNTEAVCSTNSDGDCDCLIGIEETFTSSGSYTTDNGVVSVAGDDDDYYYCVAGDTLTLRPISDDELAFTEVFVAD